jgi:hypothetical protein
VKWTSWLALAALAGLAGFIVYSSAHIGGVRCRVCMAFDARTACREVDGATEDEALKAARTNACSFLASGVTDTMACERGTPTEKHCAAR